MRFVVTGGGTGGHIYPALAIAQGLKEKYPGAGILYIGKEGGMEAGIVDKAGFPFEAISLSGLRRSLTPSNIKVIFKAAKGFIKARRIIKDFKPSAVIGTGGYVCGPVVMAAVSLGIPVFIHEQNAWPGITNRVLSVFARRVMVTFEDSPARFPRRAETVLTGLPVRPEVLNTDTEKARGEMGLEPGQLLLLSFGGSQGARSINRAMAGVLQEFRGDKRIKIIHVTGNDQYREFMDLFDGEFPGDSDNIQVIPYLHRMPEVLAATDLAVCRAGAATLAEMTVRGVPCVLVPYPYASENHQEYNARALVNKGAAEMILDKDLTGELLLEKIKGLALDKNTLTGMQQASLSAGKPRALQDILKSIEECIDEN